MRNNDACIIALVMFYETKGNVLTKVYTVLSCVLYYVKDIYVFIDYLCFHPNTLSLISSDKIFEEERYN